MPFARVRAQRAVERMGLVSEPARLSLGPQLLTFASVSEFEPRDAQQKTMSLPRDNEGSLTVLESETGSGKTEAALIRYLHLFHAGVVDGMMFALPTRTAATQLHRRVCAALDRAFPNREVRPPVVLAVPGYLQVDDESGRRLPGFEVLWNDDADARLRYRGWAAEQPKRFLAGSVVVGTIDQVLLSSLRVGHAHLRATSLLRHLLVVDEVHASDSYMNRILEEVLRFHVQAGGQAFLMSATLGASVRQRLERAAFALEPRSQRDVSLSDALSIPYPAVHHATREGAGGVRAVEAPGLPKTVQVEIEQLADHPAQLAEKAMAMARQGARVLVLRNTVADAIETQGALETLATPKDEDLLFRIRDAVTLHHARFARSDRVLLDQAIEERLGKVAPNSGGCIVITTQTVQQSLDLDADVLLTDLAPMDVLLQRFGRIHRHRERDPFRLEAFVKPKAFVLVSDKPLEEQLRKDGEARGSHGVGTVYDDVLILEATRRRLIANSTLRIPEQNRELVEVTVHPEALGQLAAQLGGLWGKHHSHVHGTQFSHRGLALLNLVDRSQRFGRYTFQTNGVANERIASRLGESDRRAVFGPESAPEGPFGARVIELNIPGWLSRSAPADPDLRPTNVRMAGKDGSRGFLFDFGSMTFRYDRLGLRLDAPATQDDDNADA
ncbi:MAG: CRISPR-associated helicase Cas3' [Polyangiaceae bacterium]